MVEYEQAALWSLEAEDIQFLKAEKLTSLLKWAGGKEKELKHILPLIPSFNSYYEPFVGGGAVLFAIQSPKSSSMINLLILLIFIK